MMAYICAGSGVARGGVVVSRKMAREEEGEGTYHEGWRALSVCIYAQLIHYYTQIEHNEANPSKK